MIGLLVAILCTSLSVAARSVKSMHERREERRRRRADVTKRSVRAHFDPLSPDQLERERAEVARLRRERPLDLLERQWTAGERQYQRTAAEREWSEAERRWVEPSPLHGGLVTTATASSRRPAGRSSGTAPSPAMPGEDLPPYSRHPGSVAAPGLECHSVRVEPHGAEADVSSGNSLAAVTALESLRVPTVDPPAYAPPSAHPAPSYQALPSA